MDLDKLSTGKKIVLAAGVLLIIDLLFLPWHQVDSVVVLGQRVGGGSAQAIEDPNGFYGVLALLITIVMVAQVVVAEFTSVKLPDIPVSWGQVHMVAGVAVLVLLGLKLLVETTALGFGSWLGILLAAGLAYGGFMINKEATTTGTTAGGLPPI